MKVAELDESGVVHQDFGSFFDGEPGKHGPNVAEIVDLCVHARSSRDVAVVECSDAPETSEGQHEAVVVGHCGKDRVMCNA